MSTGIPVKITMLPNNDLLYELEGLYDDSNDSFINGATVTATLYDSFKNQVPGCIGVSLPYVSGSNGNYQGTSPAAPFIAQFVTAGVNIQKAISGFVLVVTAIAAGVQYQISINAEIGLRRS